MWIHLVRRTPYAVISPPSGDDDAPHPGRRSASIPYATTAPRTSRHRGGTLRARARPTGPMVGPPGDGRGRGAAFRVRARATCPTVGQVWEARSLSGSFGGGLETGGGAVDVSARLRCFLQPSERPPVPANEGMRSDSVPQAGHFNYFATEQVREPSSSAAARSWQGSEVPWNPTPARTAPATLRTRKWRSAPPSCGPQRPARRPR